MGSIFLVFLLLLSYKWCYCNSSKLLETGDPKAELQRLLNDILIRNLLPYKCVTVITDSVYSSFFNRKWFHSFQAFISFVNIIIDDTEDLMSPYNGTQSALARSIEASCQMYIILLSNGIQCSRLLRFGDRYRMLDTRVKFIFLYNSRLFEKDLYYLWKRIINVVFIREYEGTTRDITKQKYPWFELITVPFPAPVTSVLVPRRLDTYSRGTFRKKVDLFREKTTDLKNQTLKVVTFSHTPGSRKNINCLNSSGNSCSKQMIMELYSGAEVEILKTLSEAMNFKYQIYEPKNADTELWGRKDSGTKYTGLIGEMIYSHADIALGDLYYIPTILNLMDLSIPYNTECLTFVTPEALTDNSWKTLILPFSGYMWLAVCLCLVVSATSFYLLAKFHDHVSSLKQKFENRKENNMHIKKKKVITLNLYPEAEKMDDATKYNIMKGQYDRPIEEDRPVGLYLFTDPVNCLLYTYSMLLLVSLPKLPTGWSLRILTGWYWLYCLLVVVAYRSSLTAILARPVARVTIDTMQELSNSKLKSGGWGEINRDFFKTSFDPIIRTIGENFETVDNSDDAIDRVADGKFAFYENIYFLKEAIVKRQLRFQLHNMKKNTTNVTLSSLTDEIVKEDRSLHIMGDCVINMPISIGLQKNSPIKPKLDKHIRRVLEAGLIKKWLDDTMLNILNAEFQTDQEETKAIMSMKKFSGALTVLIIGYILSIILFLVEVLYFNLVFKKDPNYNKYSRSIVKKSE